MREKALILEAYHKTHIEGSNLSLGESQKIWKGEKVQNTSQDDETELKNNRKAFHLVSSHLDSKYPLTEVLIREIHKSLVEDVRGNSATPGNYRKVQNFVSNSKTGEVIYTPPPAHQVPIMMQKLVDWMTKEEEIDPVLVAGIAQFQLVHIHPFLDGNGRTARLLSNLHLYQFDYNFKQIFTISEFYDRDRNAYYKAIKERKNEYGDLDLTSWLEYFTLGLATQMEDLEIKSKEALKEGNSSTFKQISENKRRSLELLNNKISDTIKRYIKAGPYFDQENLKKEINYILDSSI